MRRWVLLSVAATFVGFALPAHAQVPSTVRSSSLTVAQEQELNRRLGLLQSQMRSLASETELRESAIRNIAVEIFGARPDLDFETYAALISSGARELRTYITEARTRIDPDPASQALRAQAIAAAEDGRLTEARAFYDQLIAVNRAARQRERDDEDLADAADMAESARLTAAVGDFLDAARRMETASALAPRRSRERWLFLMHAAAALQEHGELFGSGASLMQAVLRYRAVLGLIDRRTVEWANTTNDLGNTLLSLGQLSDEGAVLEATQAFREAILAYERLNLSGHRANSLNNLGNALSTIGEFSGNADYLSEAVASYRSALAWRTRERSLRDWAMTQNNLGNALRLFGERYDAESLREAEAVLRLVATTLSESEEPELWANTLGNLAIVLKVRGERGEIDALREAASVLRSVLRVHTRSERPNDWAKTQNNIGTILYTMAVAGDPSGLADAVAAYMLALDVRTERLSPRLWADTNYNLALAHRFEVRRGDRTRLEPAMAAANAAIRGYTRVNDLASADEARAVLASLRPE